MTENQTASASGATTTPPAAPGPDDPRYAFAHVAGALGDLIEQVPTDVLANATPCPEFTVKELLEHCVLVVRRVAAIGRGEHWSTIAEEPVDAGWADQYREGTHAIMQAWSDPAILEQVMEVPWGAFPGAALMFSYTSELAVHGWDLAQGTGLAFEVEDDLLQGALMAAKFIPAEGREDPQIPFGEVVDPGPDASVLLQMAGWLGRNVNA